MAYAVCHLDGSPCRNLPRFHSGKQANKSCVTAMAFAKAVSRVPSVVFVPCAKDTVPCSQEVTGCHTWLTMKEYLLSLTSHLLPWLCCLSSEPMPAMAGESTFDAHCTHFILILHRVSLACNHMHLRFAMGSGVMLSTQDKAQLKTIILLLCCRQRHAVFSICAVLSASLGCSSITCQHLASLSASVL